MANSLGPVKRTKEARQKERKTAKGVMPLGRAIELGGSDNKPVWQYTTVNRDGELYEKSKSYASKADLEEAEETAGSQFNWKIVAYKTDGNKIGQPILDPKIAVSLLTAEGKENLIDKVYHVDELRPKTSVEGATTTEPSAPADPSAPGGKIEAGDRKGFEMFIKAMRALDPSEQTEEERCVAAFSKQFGLNYNPNADLDGMSDEELVTEAALYFAGKYTGKNVTQILAERNASQSAPALPDQTPQTPPPVQTTPTPTRPTASRRVWRNPQDGTMVDLDTGLPVQTWTNPQSGDLIDLDTGDVVQLFQPGQPTPPIATQPAAAPTQPNPVQPGQPATGPVGSPVAGPQGGTAGFATSAPPAADASLEELLKRPDMQKYLLEYGQKCSYTAVQAERKRRKENKQRKRNQGSGNGSNGGQQPGNGNA